MNEREYQIKVLGHEGNGFTEYRKFNGGEFVGINPRKTPSGTTNQDVSKITCIVIDIDLAGGNFDGAVQLANTIILGENFKSYVIAASGRGVHIYVPVSLQTNSDIKGYLKFLSTTYNTAGYNIDDIGDLARVIRVWGSTNEKSGTQCHIISDQYSGINTFKLPVFKVNTLPQNVPNDAILNGGRNNELVSLAGTMRRKGMTQKSIEVALLEENRLRCSPPLPDIEVRNIANSIMRYESKEKPEIKSLNNQSQKYLENLLNRQPGHSTGFNKLDETLVGLQPGRMYVLAARTNEGKTSFACNIAYNLIKQNVSVLYFPTELGYEPLFDKIVAQKTGIPLKLFQMGNFTDEQRTSIDSAVKELLPFPFIVHEDFALTLDKIKTRVKEIMPQVMIIDFITAMKYNEISPAEISTNVRGIKEIAEEHKIATILCAQFNRGAINNEVSMQYIKGSGAIEEFADVVMALSTVNMNVYPRVVDLHILKNRYSEIGKIRLDFYSTLGKFEEHTKNTP